MKYLPKEVIRVIFSKLNAKELGKLALVSQWWKCNSTESSLWKNFVAEIWQLEGSRLVNEADYHEVFRALDTKRPTRIDRDRLEQVDDYNLVVDADGLSALWIGHPSVLNTVIADHCFRRIGRNNWFPVAFQRSGDDTIYYRPTATKTQYFEITITTYWTTKEHENLGDIIDIGFCNGSFPVQRNKLGCRSGSWAYCGYNGSKASVKDLLKIVRYARPFGVGDVVGAGINWETSEIFFTLNGKHLGTAFNVSNEAQQEFFPAIGTGHRKKILLNFGQKPFAYDFTKNDVSP
eukprot:TRINITY_DN3883_c0_g1_i1.p1 TRINITY_DN3883_c0_g1~~TRINITY_DN3883_c0_g1_i1.p1  ORF type:complete len:291 (+),score=25.83 TRINITY_DN3883_c0_g1_i1:95-967(+)